VPKDSDLADELIPGSLKRSRSYHRDYGNKTYREIVDLAAARQESSPDEEAHRTDTAASAEEQGTAVMSRVRTFKQKLSLVSRRWEAGDFDAAVTEVESLRKVWPGNSHLLVLWASLVQLQEAPVHSLDEAKQALQDAIELDRSSPAGSIELGHFLDAVEDDPQAASKAYSEGTAVARQLLIDGLIGEAKALLQMDKRKEALRCLLEVLQLMQFHPGPKRTGSKRRVPEILSRSSSDRLLWVEVNGPFAAQVEELLNQLISSRSAWLAGVPSALSR
jgi:hypothetical protein